MTDCGRRDFLLKAGLVGTGTLAATTGCERRAPGEAVSVTPAERLMHEHGLVHRLMNAYQACADRLAAGEDFPSGALVNAGALVDEAVEAYHEEMEETFIYPVFGRAGRMRELLDVLVKQHQVGRQLAARTISLGGGGVDEPETREALVAVCRGYSRMYRGHAAYEDTMLFPQLREVLTDSEFRSLADDMQQFERETIGENGLQDALGDLEIIEQDLGIGELDVFTAEL